jgi:hypothetical protein
MIGMIVMKYGGVPFFVIDSDSLLALDDASDYDREDCGCAMSRY